MAVPAPKANQLFQDRIQIFDEFVATFQLNVVACKRLERELCELAGVREFEAFARAELGLLYAIRRNMSEASRQLARASQLGLDSAYLDLKRAHAAVLCGDIAGAAIILESMPLPPDPDRLRSIRTQLVQCGMYIKANEVVEILDKMQAPQFGEEHEVGVEDIYLGAELLKENGLTDMDVAKRVHVASQVVVRNAPSHPTLVYGYACSHEAGILYEFPLNLPIEHLVKIDWEISEALVDEFDDPLIGVISFVARPFSESLRCIN